MNIFIAIANNGLPAYSIQTSDVMEKVVDIKDIYRMKPAPEGMDVNDLLTNYYWKGDWRILPARPNIHCIWEGELEQWLDPRTLDELRDLKWEELRTMRDQLEETSFPYLGRDIQSDMKSVLRINTAVKAADYAQANGQAFATEWRCLDDTLLPLDGPAMQLMPVALAAYAQSLHSHANTLRAQVYSAPDAAALALIAW